VKDSLNYFITSNRNHASKNKTCCTDIYQLSPINSKIDSLSYKSNIDSTINLIIAEKTNRTKNNIDKLEQLIPISLYFHNDIPNPKSNDTTTYLNYLETYENYNLLNGTYTIKYTEGLIGDNKINAQKEINDFFALNLQKGKKDLDDFLDIMLEELRKGGKFELIFKGYASPLAKNNYNKFLSKRRINSVKNYIGIYKNGILLNYLISETENRTPAITFKEESYGEYLSNKLVSDNPNDIKNSIYSVKAALERKVEIIGFRIR
jgi:outer membrane protein OmpA-like peptidoglycan-associated protein